MTIYKLAFQLKISVSFWKSMLFFLHTTKTKRKPADACGRRRSEDPAERKLEEAEDLLHGKPAGWKRSFFSTQPETLINSFKKLPVILHSGTKTEALKYSSFIVGRRQSRRRIIHKMSFRSTPYVSKFFSLIKNLSKSRL
jgi:hypothetical protein